jgi:hypothetical protein
MDIDVEIDEFTPCLVERATGKIINTRYFHISQNDLKQLKDWKFNWQSIYNTPNCEVSALCLENSNNIEGVIAYMPKKENASVYVLNVETAPHNYGHLGKYYGVGGHLFAIAIKKSIESGYGGHIYFSAKTKLIDYYKEMLGARVVMSNSNTMEVSEHQAMKVYERYMKGSVCDD